MFSSIGQVSHYDKAVFCNDHTTATQDFLKKKESLRFRTIQIVDVD